MNLSAHFTLEELVASATAQRLGIDNSPSLETISRLTVLALGLEKVRTLLGHPMHIDSGFRCEALEKVLTAKDFALWCKRHGQAPDADGWAAYFARKAHPKGYAADFTCPGFGSPLEIVRAIQASPIMFDQCIQEGTWVHISFAPGGRRQVLTATFGADGPTYSQGVA